MKRIKIVNPVGIANSDTSVMIYLTRPVEGENNPNNSLENYQMQRGIPFQRQRNEDPSRTIRRRAWSSNIKRVLIIIIVI